MLIDEKGRLFGKINLIDFLVIVFLLALTPMFWFGYKIFTKRPAPTPAPTPTQSISLEEYELWQAIKKEHPRLFKKKPICPMRKQEISR